MKPAQRRSGRDDRSQPQRRTFTVDSKSTLLEFLDFKPETILSIETTPAHREQWLAACDKAGLGPGLVRVNPDLDTPVLATVKLSPVPWQRFAASEFADDELVIVLDHITDPRNLGAIARSAGFFGVKWILAPQRRQVLYTQASVATSMGGFARTDLVAINNVSDTLNDLRREGFKIIGAHMNGSPLNQIGTLGRFAVVLGAEDKGLGPKVQEHCDELVTISRQRDGIDSLNVSVAAGIIISRFLS